VCLEERRGKTTEPIARLTPLGWTCFGPVSDHDTDAPDTLTFLADDTQEPLDAVVQKFWALESQVKPSSAETASVDDKRAEDIVNRGKSFEDGRFVFNIPWNTPEGQPHLRSNRDQAQRRLHSLEKSLSQKPAVSEEYHRVMAAHEEKGYIRPVTESQVQEDGENQWYLPHFPVIKADRTTTKVRVVYDAAAEWDGTSINQQMYSGPALQNNIVDVLLRFSAEPVALVGDISEMFLQVGLAEEDKKYHRVLWRASTTEAVQTYEFNRVVFGVRASPYLAGKAIKESAAKFGGDYSPTVTSLLDDSFYVDDMLGSLTHEQAAITARLETQELLSRGGFHIRKWLSNSEAVMTTIPECDRATGTALHLGDHAHCTLPTVKTLGVSWSAERDAFTFRFCDTQPKQFTKRSVLRGLSTVFDPRGQIAPFTVRAKVLFQDAWLCNSAWDDPLPEPQVKSWRRWFSELPDLADINIPRSFKDGKLRSEDATLTVHTFTDASDRALAAASYVRAEYPTGDVRVTLGLAKAKPAPIRRQTIPLMELQAAVMGVHLSQQLESVLGVPMSAHSFWTDSMNVLGWIQAHSRRFKVEVGNRVSKIQDATSPEQWRHVPGRMNPADKGTRGLKASDLATDDSWWHAPEFLQSTPDTWPVKEVQLPETLPGEVKHAASTFHVATTDESDRLNPANYSKWIRLVRVTAWILRWRTEVARRKSNKSTGANSSVTTTPVDVNSCRTTTSVSVLATGNMPKTQKQSTGTVKMINVHELSVDEMKVAECRWFAKAQQDAYGSVLDLCASKQPLPPSSPLYRLQPVLDEESPRLLRMNGRLSSAHHLPEGIRRPIILPEKHPVTALRIAHEDAANNHTAGVNHLLSCLNTEFWIVHGPAAVKRHRSNCPACKKIWAKPAKQQMAPLPEFRTSEPQRAFCRVGVDYAGPFLTKQGRGKSRMKRYLCVFTCLHSRAVHLEMARSTTTHRVRQRQQLCRRRT